MQGHKQAPLSIVVVTALIVLSVPATIGIVSPTDDVAQPDAETAVPDAAVGDAADQAAPPNTTLEEGRGCTMVIVGKNASATGSVLLGRTEDYAGNWPKQFRVQPAEEHAANATIEAFNGLVWPLPNQTHKYIAAKDWTTKWGRFHEFSINSEGVGVTATTTTSINEQVKEVDPLVEGGIHEGSVATIVSQRADTPREGVELVGEIIEEEGASQAFGMAIANGSEAWLIEVGGGHHWAAYRIPDDEYFVGANANRIGEVNLSSPDYMGSDDLISFAKEHDLYDPETEEFDFAEAYGTAEDYANYNYRRVWGGIKFFGASDAPWDGDLPDPANNTYPLTLEPTEDISVSDVMAFQRYHYQGTEHDLTTTDEPLPRSVGTTSSIEAHVLQLREEGPTPISDVAWVSMSTPLGSPYVPYYLAMDEFPEPYQKGTPDYDDDAAYWQFRTVSNLMFQNYTRYGPMVQNSLEEFETTQLELQEQKEQRAAELWDENETAAKQVIANYSTDRAWKALELAEDLEGRIHENMSAVNGWSLANQGDTSPAETNNTCGSVDTETATATATATETATETATATDAPTETETETETETPTAGSGPGFGVAMAVLAVLAAALVAVRRR